MRQRALISALTLVIAGAWSSQQGAMALSSQGQSSWLRTQSRHFEIHYPPSLAPELDRVIRSAERAYDRISGDLNFVFAKKVPLVMFAPSGPMTREQVVTYATSEQVAPPAPHRSRLVLPLPEDEAKLHTLVLHELTHLLVAEVILPETPGDGGVPRWVHEGIASYMADGWSDDHERLIRELVVAGKVPFLSQLTGSGAFANPRVNDALGHVAFDYIASRWGAASVRRFIDALIVPRVDRTYDAVFELTPAEFDAAFRQYVERRFTPVVR